MKKSIITIEYTYFAHVWFVQLWGMGVYFLGCKVAATFNHVGAWVLQFLKCHQQEF